MYTPQFSISKARETDLVDYLESLGHRPRKIAGNDYWYLSPLRTEKTASFKVNRKLNVWYDHWIGKGGNLVDFGIFYFNCPVKDFLQLLKAYPQTLLPSFFQPQFQLQNMDSSNQYSAGEKKENGPNKITVMDVRQLQDKGLLEYLVKRCIHIDVARQFCKEVDFELFGKRRTVIGFENNAGGFELRGHDFKSSSPTKTSTFVDHGKEAVSVFEGFFNYLSYQTINQKQPAPLTNFLVPNSPAFFETEKIRMDQHNRVDLYLDRDLAGRRFTQQCLKFSEKFVDRSDKYHYHKDLNEWLVWQNHPDQKQSQRLGRHL